MKFIIVCLLAITMQIAAMDKIIKMGGSPRGKEEKKEKEEKQASPRQDKHKKDEKEKSRTSRDEKHRRAADNLKESTRALDRKALDTPALRETKSASPSHGSPARPHTVGKRSSLDWTAALHMDDSIKKWGEKDAAEEYLRKLFMEFSTADDRRKAEIYCTVMRAPAVSAIKEEMASNFFEISYKMAVLALYNIPNYYLTNLEEARREIQTFWKALFDAKEAYVNKLSAEAPKRPKWHCEQTVLSDTKSPIIQLLAQFNALPEQHRHLKEHSKDFEPELIALPEPKKP